MKVSTDCPSCYTCVAMHYVRMRPDGKIPKTTPRDCPIKDAKRKGL